MRKIVIIELAIIISTLVIVLPLAFLAAQNISVTKNYENIDVNNADRYLSFDLKSGQTVRGSYIVDPINGNEHTFCAIIDPNGNEMISSPTYYEYDRNKATFSFTANIKGRYYLSISIDDLWSHYIDYEYSISSPLILGFDPIVLIGLVITVAVVLTLVNGLLNLYLPRRRKNLFRRSIKCNLKQNMLRFTNEKVVKLEIIIFVVTVVVVLTFAFTGQSSYAGYQTIDWNNASRALTFDLQTGQTVTGSFSLAGNERTDYIIYNQDIGEIIVSQTSEHKGDFTFTAKTDGQYILRIHVENPFSEYMDYSYSISTPSILGVDRTVLTGIVITIGVVLALTIAVWDLRRTRMKKKTRKSIDKALPVQSIIKI